jgi:urease accessory protein
LIIDRIVGNVSQYDIGNRQVETVYLHSDDLVKRIQRVTTDHGREIGIRLKDAQDLTDGDILYLNEQTAIVVSVLEDDLLVIRPRNLKQMGEIAHQIGNRHLPAQFEGEEMWVQYDRLVEELLQQLDIPYERAMKKVRQAFRHVGHHHG